MEGQYNMSKKIKLTQGKYALVDNEDFQFLDQWKWFFDLRDGYARTNSGKILMHRLINGTPKGFITDHINRNKLDNRKENLRTVDKSLNAFNTGLWKHNKSGFKGVSWDKLNQKWRASINKNGKAFNLGRYPSLKLALLARKKAEAIYAI